MSNYTKTTDFDVKDSLPSGDTGKIIRGSEFEVEFENIEVAIASKADSLNTVLTGTTTATNLSVTGNTTLGNAASDTVTVNADFSSDLLPSADATYDLGAPGSEWQDLYVTGTANVDSLVADTVAISGGTVTATLTGNVTGDLTGTVLTAAQPNITSLGTLTSASISGDLVVDTNTLFVDASEDRVGINRSTPRTELEIGLNDTTTTTLGQKGGVMFYSASSTAGNGGEITWNSGVGNTETWAGISGSIVNNGSAGSTGSIVLATKENQSDTELTARMTITPSGNVGIGTDAPATILHLAEDNPLLRFEDTAGGAPYTFDVGSDGGLFKVINTTSATTPFVIEGATGDVGIGTTNPAADLEVSSDANTKVRISDSTNVNQRFEIRHNAGFTAVTAGNNGAKGVLAFYQYDGTDTTEAVRIDASGNVGIGTSSPQDELHVAGDIRTDNAGYIVTENNAGNAVRMLGINSGNFAYIGPIDNGATTSIFNAAPSVTSSVFYTGGSEAMRIDSSGKVGIGVSSNLGGALTLPHQESISFQDASGSARRCLEFDSGELLHGSAGAGLNTQTFYINGSEAMRIDSSGNVGIGTSTPNRLLEISSAGSTFTRISSTASGGSYSEVAHGSAQGNLLLSADAGNDLSGSYIQMSVDGTERARIDASGNVGIGTTTPARKLHVNDTMRLEPRATAPSSPSAGDIFFNSTSETLEFYDGTAWVAASGGGSTNTVISTVTTTSTSKTLAVGERCYVDTAGQTITLPATPSSGDIVSVVVDNFINTVVARNGSTIMGAAENFTIDSAYASVDFQYIGSTWRLV